MKNFKNTWFPLDVKAEAKFLGLTEKEFLDNLAVLEKEGYLSIKKSNKNNRTKTR